MEINEPAYTKGMYDYADGIQQWKNPYPTNEIRNFKLWDQGWKDAKEEQRSFEKQLDRMFTT